MLGFAGDGDGNRRGTVASDALADVLLPVVLGMLIAEHGEPPSADGAEVFLRDLGGWRRGQRSGRCAGEGSRTGQTGPVYGASHRTAGRVAQALQGRGAVVGADSASALARGGVLSL